MSVGSRAALVGVCLLLLVCGGEPSDPWIAEVDGQAIPFSTLREALESRTSREPDAPRERLLLEELNRLVTQRVVLNRAEALGIQVSDADVDARMRQLMGEQAGEIDPSYREQVRLEMTRDRAAIVELAERIEVPESAVLLHLDENRERYRIPERVQIRHIVVQDEAKARRLLAELRAGADFAALAREHSVAPEEEREAGGLLPPFARGELPEAFDAAHDLRRGRLSEVIPSPFGYHIFRLEEKLAAVEPTLESVGERIRSQLMQARLAEHREDWERELRRAATIRVNEDLLETLR